LSIWVPDGMPQVREREAVDALRLLVHVARAVHV
jgi:hypothetical protein